MQQKLFNDFLKAIPTLTPFQFQTLDKQLLSAKTEKGSANLEPCCRPATSQKSQSKQTVDLKSVIEMRFASSPQCPFCHCEEAIRWGVRKGQQRYRCKSCRSTFCALTLQLP